MQENLGRMRPLIAAAAVFLLVSCTATFRTHGYVPPDYELSQLSVGKDTRESVAAAIGQPRTDGLVNSSNWYYVQSRYRHWAYKAPEEVDRQILVFTFNSAGVVSNIERFGIEDGRVIVLERRVTETTGGDITFVQQLMGNASRPSASALF